MKVDGFLKKLIGVLFSLLFLLVPLFFTPVNSELFEFNKMILVYGLTTLIVGAWAGRMLLQGKILFKRTPLDIPLLLFLISQFASTLLSIDRHTSLFGYYSRFNGGLLSTISYLLLFWALVSNCEAKDVLKFLKVSLITAMIVAIYGIFEHFGHSFSCLMFEGNFNVSCWVQKVQERVFATLGQPNWLAAYLAILIPFTWYFILRSKIKMQSSKPSSKIKNLFYYFLSAVYFSCLLFTQSRSGLLGFALSFGTFWVIVFLIQKNNRKLLIKPFLFLIFALCLLIFIFGSPFPQINKYFYYKSFISRVSTHNPPSQLDPQLTTHNSPSPSSDDGGISTSSDIRKIVWKGAFAIFKHYPLFGSGVETFAYSYYNFRPMEHNLVSEWDFLYNKAHNEYLNFLSTTGIFGLGTYLLFICAFVIWNIIQIKNQISKIKNINQNLKTKDGKSLTFNFDFDLYTLIFALLAGWLSILVSNFFGFSVVVVSLYFYLIPAFCVVLLSPLDPQPTLTTRPTTHNSLSPKPLTLTRKAGLILLLFTLYYLLFTIVNLWRADYFYSRGQKLTRQNQWLAAYENFYQAKNLSPNEPVILGDISSTTANLALLAATGKEASAAAELTQLAITYSDRSLAISPANLNLYKTRTKVFYTLSAIEPNYLAEAIKTLETATKLAPTDPKLIYNLGLFYGRLGETQKAIGFFQKAIEMKPNYIDARNALATFYEELGKSTK